jgi:hypothetical protein
MVAVQNAQRRSDLSSLLKISTVATPIEPDICSVLARATSSLPFAGPRKFTLISTVTPDPSLRQAGSDGDAGGLIGERRNHPAVEMAEELYQIVAARQREFGSPWLDRDDAETGGAGKTLRIDGGSQRRWIEGVVHVRSTPWCGRREMRPFPPATSTRKEGRAQAGPPSRRDADR